MARLDTVIDPVLRTMSAEGQRVYVGIPTNTNNGLHSGGWPFERSDFTASSKGVGLRGPWNNTECTNTIPFRVKMNGGRPFD